MSFTSDSKEQISLKKLLGKAHTKNEFEFYNESKSTGVTVSAGAVFGQDLPATPSRNALYQISSSVVEYVRLPLTPLAESIQNGKYHAFSASLPTTYENLSTNPNKGNGVFDDDEEVHASSGKLQLVPTSFGELYVAKVFHGGSGGFGTGNEISSTDSRRWYLDYFNGILFQQNPPDNPNSNDHLNNPNNPSYIEAFVYIGKMASERFTEGSGGGGGGGGGASVLNDLTDVNTIGVTENQILKWNGNAFAPADDTDTQLADEQVQDIVGEMVSGSTNTGISVAYADNGSADGKLNFTVDLSSFSIASLSDVSTISTIASGQILKWNGSSFAPADDTDTDTQLTDEQVQDIVGEMVSGSTNTGISVTYADNSSADGKLNFTVDNTIARLASPTFTGSPIAPTAAAGTDNTQIATTAFVNTKLTEYISASALSLNSLNDVSFISGSDAQILVYNKTNDGNNNNDNWQNVTVSGDVTIDNSGAATIAASSVLNSKISTPYIDILSGTLTDRLKLGETLTIVGSQNEIEVSITNDVSGATPGATLSIGLPNDVKVEGNLTVGGDLFLSGSATTIVTTNLDVTDSIISLNNGIIGDDENNPVSNPAVNDIGLFFDRGALNPALFFWDEADDVFKLGTNSGSVDSTASDLHDGNFSYSILEAATIKNQNAEIDLTSNDNTAATTEWTTAKIANTSIDDLVNVSTNGAAEGKVLKFNSALELVAEDESAFTADTSSLWALDSSTGNLFPHGIIDGTLDTGMFAINLSAGSINYADPNITLHNILEELSAMNAYTPSTRSANNISDTFFEIITINGEECIRPKLAS